MGSYVLVETRDPFESAAVSDAYELATGLADNGDDVTLYLAQNGVLAARRAARSAQRVGTLATRTRVLADDFALRERGIGADELAPGVQPSSIDELIDLVMKDRRKVIWH